MKKILLAGAAVAVLVHGAANAADLRRTPPPQRAYAPAPAVPLYSWQGFYVGIVGGYGWGDTRHTNTLNGVTTGNFDVRGPLLGATIGYNLQTGPWVVGVEGDLSWARVRGSTTAVACGPTPCSSDLRWLGTIRPRVGYTVMPNVLLFATGGAAFGNVRAGIDATAFIGNATHIGWTVGGGVEAMIAPQWTVKAEYLYVDLGTKQTYTVPAGPIAVDYKSHIGRVGVNFKF
jgi:outer membrane immunogenic protein